MAKDDIIRTMDYDHEGDTVIVKSSQDISSIIKGNLEAQNDKSMTRGVDMRHVARIPFVVIEQWKKQGIDFNKKEDWPKIKKMLNDPDLRYFRTDLGEI